jgi:hypothetical protein
VAPSRAATARPGSSVATRVTGPSFGEAYDQRVMAGLLSYETAVAEAMASQSAPDFNMPAYDPGFYGVALPEGPPEALTAAPTQISDAPTPPNATDPPSPPNVSVPAADAAITRLPASEMPTAIAGPQPTELARQQPNH